MPSKGRPETLGWGDVPRDVLERAMRDNAASRAKAVHEMCTRVHNLAVKEAAALAEHHAAVLGADHATARDIGDIIRAKLLRAP